MNSYLDLIPLSAKRHRRQGKMTLYCIALSVFLVTVIFGMAEMAIRSQQYQEIKKNGNWHVLFSDVDGPTSAIIQARPEVTGSGWYGYVDKAYEIAIGGFTPSITGMDETVYKSMFFSSEITEGSFPQTMDEVVLSEHAKVLLNLRVGDSIRFDGIKEPLTITGFAADSASQMKQDTFSVLLSMDGLRAHVPSECYTEQLVVQLSVLCNMQKVIADITVKNHLTDKQVLQNGNLLAVLGQSDNDFIMQVYGCAMILFFLVLIASVLMITSSLNSNVMQRTEFFGMLRCIGATKKQIMQFVRREALGWCKSAVPLGLISGIVVVWGLCGILKSVSPDYFAELPVFRLSWLSIVSGTAVGLLTVLVAAQAPAKKASEVSPLTAVTGNAFRQHATRMAANTRRLKIDCSLGIHHAISNRKNFVLITMSFALSIILFLAFSPVIDFMNHSIKALEPYTPDVSIISNDNQRTVPKELMMQLEKEPFVKRAYGRMFAYDLPAVISDKNSRINLISYEEHQTKWSNENLSGGKNLNIQSPENEALIVYNPENIVKTGDVITLSIDGQKQKLKIVGVLSKSPFTNTRDTVDVICTESTFQRLYGETQYTVIDLQLVRGTSDEAVNTVRELAGSGYSFSDRRQDNQEDTGVYYSFALFIYGFVIIIALIAVFNIINSMNMSVSARISQYGTMRAIGMDNRQLKKMITAEAAMYSLTGSMIGGIIGLGLHKYLFEHMVTYRWGDTWELPVIILSIIVTLVIIATFIAVRNSARRI